MSWQPYSPASQWLTNQDRSVTPQKAKKRAALLSSPNAAAGPSRLPAFGLGTATVKADTPTLIPSRGGLDLQPPSARAARAARRQSQVDHEPADGSWLKLLFRVSPTVSADHNETREEKRPLADVSL